MVVRMSVLVFQVLQNGKGFEQKTNAAKPEITSDFI